ncbi:MAG: LLM class flavin-dependent oxidoreductase [Chloroflexi bacterium]|jgi:alkanesulfonate monooxygenase SsuD/methylene tetrahydromethanopterin reductase-like flavin-dependent oxidoreductase (luciferase family)|nr:LLM class flavin-dependent oxidoreductase [Chloroflexota bacterium]
MAVEFGLALVERQPRGPLNNWLDDLDTLLPILDGHFQSLWMTDHLFWQDWFTFEAWTALCFLAARWPSYQVGSMVMCQSYRNPALLAKMAASLQVLSQGRLLLGVGAGWKEDEYKGYGYPFPPLSARRGQLEDTLEILKRLWTEPGKVTYQGSHYSVTEAYCEPKPDPLPPVIVGGGGDKTLMMAARYADWWNVSDKNFPAYQQMVAKLHQDCASIGRAPSSIRLTWFGRIVLGATEAEAVELGQSGLLKWTRDNAFVGTPEQVIEQMRPFVELGVDYFMVEVLGLPDKRILKMLLEDLLPQIKQMRVGG